MAAHSRGPKKQCCDGASPLLGELFRWPFRQLRWSQLSGLVVRSLQSVLCYFLFGGFPVIVPALGVSGPFGSCTCLWCCLLCCSLVEYDTCLSQKKKKKKSTNISQSSGKKEPKKSKSIVGACMRNVLNFKHFFLMSQLNHQYVPNLLSK